MIFSVATVFAAPESDSGQKVSKKLEFKPTPFLSPILGLFFHKRDGLGFNMLGIDLALLKYRVFYFLNFGVGLAEFAEKKTAWVRYGYYASEFDPERGWRIVFHVYDEGWKDYRDPYFTQYFKFSPVKVPLNITKNMRDTAFLEVCIFSQRFKKVDGWGVVMTFSFNVFKD